MVKRYASVVCRTVTMREVKRKMVQMMMTMMRSKSCVWKQVSEKQRRDVAV